MYLWHSSIAQFSCGTVRFPRQCLTNLPYSIIIPWADGLTRSDLKKLFDERNHIKHDELRSVSYLYKDIGMKLSPKCHAAKSTCSDHTTSLTRV
jgi:hypothetical protein